MKKIILIGAGGYAKSVVDSLKHRGEPIAGFLEQFTQIDEHLGYPVIARSVDDMERPENYRWFICVGNNRFRRRWYERLRQRNLEIINVIDPTAVISDGATLGEGCFVGKQAVVNAGVTVRDNVIINTRAIVEHGCTIAEHANVSTGAIVNGDVRIGEGAFIGSRSVVVGQLQIGDWSVIGAGAVVVRDVDQRITVVGCPAREIGGREKK